ncbi:MAG: sigma-70 family RNA polymerase sigma factor [Lachnospiraceae bacterium]|nr:sigma-70 family RNA polymerase sigma factor [Lachnospiraceae bacterium]
MSDNEIIELFIIKSENAIYEAERKYKSYCYSIAYGILNNHEDAEECLNDTWLAAWKSIAREPPNNLAVYLGRITRNGAINTYKKRNCQKRGNGAFEVLLDELSSCTLNIDYWDEYVESKCIQKILNEFLSKLNQESRSIFIQRYWYAKSIKDISDDFQMSESKVKMQLFRSRKKLRKMLVKEKILYER